MYISEEKRRRIKARREKWIRLFSKVLSPEGRKIKESDKQLLEKVRNDAKIGASIEIKSGGKLERYYWCAKFVRDVLKEGTFTRSKPKKIRTCCRCYPKECLTYCHVEIARKERRYNYLGECPCNSGEWNPPAWKRERNFQVVGNFHNECCQHYYLREPNGHKFTLTWKVKER
jgi:hypothetical protein